MGIKGVPKTSSGRKLRYMPEYCEIVENVGRNGGWLAEMAEACDVNYTTLENWALRHSEFRESLERAKQKCRAYLEEQGISGIWAGSGFNSAAWKITMSSRFREDYGDQKKLDHTSSDGSMTPRKTSIDFSKLTKEARLQLLEAMESQDPEDGDEDER